MYILKVSRPHGHGYCLVAKPHNVDTGKYNICVLKDGNYHVCCGVSGRQFHIVLNVLMSSVMALNILNLLPSFGKWILCDRWPPIAIIKDSHSRSNLFVKSCFMDAGWAFIFVWLVKFAMVVGVLKRRRTLILVFRSGRGKASNRTLFYWPLTYNKHTKMQLHYNWHASPV